MSRYTFKVYPEGLGRKVYRTMEISGEETLDVHHPCAEDRGGEG